MSIEELARAVIFTLEKLDIKPTRGNMDKLLGCFQALDAIIKQEGERKKNDSPDE